MKARQHPGEVGESAATLPSPARRSARPRKGTRPRRRLLLCVAAMTLAACARAKPIDANASVRRSVAHVHRSHAMSMLRGEEERLRAMDARIAEAVALTDATNRLVERLRLAIPTTDTPTDARPALDALREHLALQWATSDPTWRRPAQADWAREARALLVAIDRLCAAVDAGQRREADLAYEGVIEHARRWERAARALADVSAADRERVWGP